MWNSIELVEIKFIIRSNIDIGALVLGAIAVPWCGEN